MPTVIIPFPLRIHCNNKREVNVEGHTLKETMEGLFREHPELKAIGDDTELLAICINNKLTRTARDQWDLVYLNGDEEIALIIPICGG
ncbi:MAG: hypothetical protein SWE60_09045 [Thermodesulfobacteriota bacterium]|nr:hypothetical protein [Thermodesulfobacteriota bacterium]